MSMLRFFSQTNTHFDQFYNECLPRSCTYTNKQRRGILASLLLLIAICGGLNKMFRILIPLFGKIIFSCIDWWKRRHTRHTLINRNIDKKYSLSSIMDYEKFLKDHPSDDITCPCTHISIPYGDFINELQVDAFHEACSTNAIFEILTDGNMI
ncbi:unnamed protein product [Adineta steineri]|uniref:Uncharacterized protein n=1 Tax=Adineta steineri TaxID=433720 RepID=A0A813XVJ0_9BILA|nr:unnamed protein product [Adineta steineri]